MRFRLYLNSADTSSLSETNSVQVQSVIYPHTAMYSHTAMFLWFYLCLILCLEANVTKVTIVIKYYQVLSIYTNIVCTTLWYLCTWSKNWYKILSQSNNTFMLIIYQPNCIYNNVPGDFSTKVLIHVKFGSKTCVHIKHEQDKLKWGMLSISKNWYSCLNWEEFQCLGLQRNPSKWLYACGLIAPRTSSKSYAGQNWMTTPTTM